MNSVVSKPSRSRKAAVRICLFKTKYIEVVVSNIAGSEGGLWIMLAQGRNLFKIAGKVLRSLVVSGGRYVALFGGKEFRVG